MKSLINNLLNGNLSEAKRQAKRFSNWRLREALKEEAGYSDEKATLCADWLKGRDCWQAYCDAF